MSHLNLKQFSLVACLAFLTSCQSVQSPKTDVEATIVKKDIKTEPKIDEGLITINNAIEHIKINELQIAEDMLKAYLDNHNDKRVKINLALIYMKMNKLELAKKLFTSVQDIDANNPIVLEHLAIISRQQGDFQQAKSFYVQALNVSEKPSIHLNYAILLDLYLNELKMALQHYEIYKNSKLAKIDNIELDKWIADLNVRIKREN